MLALAITGPAAAQMSKANVVASAVAPKLMFSRFELDLAKKISGEPGLAAFYGSNGLKPVFIGPDAAPLREALIATLRDSGSHGLPSAKYAPDDLAGMALDGPDPAEIEAGFALTFAAWANDVGNGLVTPSQVQSDIKREVVPVDLEHILKRFVTAPDPAGVLAKVPPQDPRYQIMHDMAAQKTRVTPPAGTPPAPDGLWRVGSKGQGVMDLRARLAAYGFPTQAPESEVFDDDLAVALSAYQTQAGLNPDGVMGPKTAASLNGAVDARTKSLFLAMERMRWLNGHDLNARHVWVNLPDYSAQILQDGTPVFDTKVVIGKTDAQMQTPEFSDNMAFVVVNPNWNVPRSITVKEYLPRLRQNPNSVGHLDVVDSKGRIIPRSQIDFAKYTEANFPYRMRQKPSEDNALGLVKFIFPNKWNIYLHDTPSKHLFNRGNRAFSHGCVRIGKPFELAYELLSQQTSDPQGMFHTALKSGDEKWIKLQPSLPIHLVYFTMLPDQNGFLRHSPDIYGRDPILWNALQKAGLE